MPIIGRYRRFTRWPRLELNLLYLVLPWTVIVFAFGQSPLDYGLGLGDWRRGLAFTLIVGGAVAVGGAWAARRPDLRAYYGRGAVGAGSILAESAGALLGWEFFFRGFLLFGLGQLYGADAIWLQAVPFALAHLGKPWLEALLAFPGAVITGYIAWMTGSFWYPFLIHWAQMSAVLWAARRDQR